MEQTTAVRLSGPIAGWEYFVALSEIIWLSLGAFVGLSSLVGFLKKVGGEKDFCRKTKSGELPREQTSILCPRAFYH